MHQYNGLAVAHGYQVPRDIVAPFLQCDQQLYFDMHGPMRERERDYTYPALRLIQVLPGHPLADPKDETVSS